MLQRFPKDRSTILKVKQELVELGILLEKLESHSKEKQPDNSELEGLLNGGMQKKMEEEQKSDSSSDITKPKKSGIGKHKGPQKSTGKYKAPKEAKHRKNN